VHVPRDSLDMFERRHRKNAVPEIEDVAGPAAYTIEDVLSPIEHAPRRAEQQCRIEIALHGAIAANAIPRHVHRETPIDIFVYEPFDFEAEYERALRASSPGDPPARSLTFPSRMPVFSMDRIYMRGLQCLSTSVPRGAAWARMSDHLPLVAELTLA